MMLASRLLIIRRLPRGGGGVRLSIEKIASDSGKK